MRYQRIQLKLAYARSQGRAGGRRHKLSAEQAALAKRMRESGETAALICMTLGISRSTLGRYLADDTHGLASRPAAGVAAALRS